MYDSQLYDYSSFGLEEKNGFGGIKYWEGLYKGRKIKYWIKPNLTIYVYHNGKMGTTSIYRDDFSMTYGKVLNFLSSFRFEITLYEINIFLRMIFNAQDTKLGNEKFDHIYEVVTGEEDKIKKIIDTDIQENILKLDVPVLNIDKRRIIIYEDLVRTSREFIQNKEKIFPDLINLCVKIAENIEKISKD